MPRVATRVSGRSCFVFTMTVDEEDGFNFFCQEGNAESFRKNNACACTIAGALVI